MKYIIKKTDRFDRWLQKLKDVKAKITIARRVDRLYDGYFGDFKSVGNGLLELRVAIGPGYRVYFTKREENIIIILIGGDKSTQQRDIKLAKKIIKGLS